MKKIQLKEKLWKNFNPPQNTQQFLDGIEI